MCDLDDDAEPIGVVRMLDGDAQQSVGTFLGDDTSSTRFDDRRIESIEPTYQIRSCDHALPDPVLILVTHQGSEQASKFVDGVRDRRKTTSIPSDTERLPFCPKHSAKLFDVGLEHGMCG